MNVSYVTNDSGIATAVVVPIDEWSALLAKIPADTSTCTQSIKKRTKKLSKELLHKYIGGWESFNSDVPVEQIASSLREGRSFDF